MNPTSEAVATEPIVPSEQHSDAPISGLSGDGEPLAGNAEQNAAEQPETDVQQPAQATENSGASEPSAPAKRETYLETMKKRRSPKFSGLVDLSEHKAIERTDNRLLGQLTSELSPRSNGVRSEILSKVRTQAAGKREKINFCHVSEDDLLYGNGLKIFGSGKHNTGTIDKDLLGDISETEGDLGRKRGLISVTGSVAGVCEDVTLVFGDATLCLNGVDVTHFGDRDEAQPIIDKINEQFRKLAELGTVPMESAEVQQILEQVEDLRNQMLPYMSCLTGVLTAPIGNYDSDFEAAAAKIRRENFAKLVLGRRFVCWKHNPGQDPEWTAVWEEGEFCLGSSTWKPIEKTDVNGASWVVGLVPHKLDVEWAGQIPPLIPGEFVEPFNLPANTCPEGEWKPYQMLPESPSWDDYQQLQAVLAERKRKEEVKESSGVSLADAYARQNAKLLAEISKWEKKAAEGNPVVVAVAKRKIEELENQLVGGWTYDPVLNKSVRKMADAVDNVDLFATAKQREERRIEEERQVEELLEAEFNATNEAVDMPGEAQMVDPDIVQTPSDVMDAVASVEPIEGTVEAPKRKKGFLLSVAHFLESISPPQNDDKAVTSQTQGSESKK